MKRIFTLFAAVLLGMALPMMTMGQTRTEATITFADLGFENAEEVDGVPLSIDNNITVVFNKANGNTTPKYYNTGAAIRAYAGNTIVLTAGTGMITGITFTQGSGDGSNTVSVDVGTVEYPTWVGSSGEVTFTIDGTSGHRRVAGITVTYQTDSNQVAAPVLSPAGGTIYTNSVTVTASCATDGAVIRYTTNGSDPTESSTTFPAAGLTLTQTTTVKARAFKSGMTASSVTSATYTFQNIQMYPNIAAWKAAHPETDATVSGISGNVTAVFQSGTNLFVQDGTGGLLIYGNVSNTYNNGDVISGGLVGTSSLYNGLLEFVPTQNPAPGTPGTPIVPADVTAAEIDANFSVWESKLVKLTDITFTEDHVFNTSNTAGRTTPFTQGQVSMNVFDNFRVLAGFEVHADQEADLTGFVGVFGDTKQINPRSTEDIYLYDAPLPTVSTPVIDPNGGLFTEPVAVTLTCATDGSTIHYSTTGANGPWTTYSAPIQVAGNTTLWAYATKDNYLDSDVVSAEFVVLEGVTIIFNQDWETEEWNGWTTATVTGDPLWTIASHSGNYYAYANGYNHPATQDWLISPVFNINAYADVMLSFRTAKNFTGPDLEVLFSSDYNGGDPSAATWLPISCELSEGSWNWVLNGAIPMGSFSGNNCHIAFKYTSTDDAAAGWEVDDIILYCSGMSGDPVLQVSNSGLAMTYVYEAGPSATMQYTLSGNYLQGSGEVFVEVDGPFEISENGTDFISDFSVPYLNGEIENQPIPIYVRLIAGLAEGDYQGTISHYGGGASVDVQLTGTVTSNLVAMMNATMPLYIQGVNNSNNYRVPVAIPANFSGLESNATYRYINQFVVATDNPETAGAGNVIFTNPSGFTRTTNPSLATDGAYGEFTTDANGNAFVWLMSEPTANNRFTPGNHVYARVRLNNGDNSTEVAHILTSTDYATVLTFGTENESTMGSAFYVRSREAAKNMAMLYDDDKDVRPLFATSIETTGIDYASINQIASFYRENVAGQNGYFGGILPNVNSQGVKLIKTFDLSGTPVNEYEQTLYVSFAPTINPHNGHNDPIYIDLLENNVAEGASLQVKVWNSGKELVVENQEQESMVMTVYNVLGQAVMHQVIPAESVIRKAHTLADGLYIISLQNERGVSSAKIVVR